MFAYSPLENRAIKQYNGFAHMDIINQYRLKNLY